MTRLEPTTLDVENLCDMFDYEPPGGAEDLADKGSRVGSVGVPRQGAHYLRPHDGEVLSR